MKKRSNWVLTLLLTLVVVGTIVVPIYCNKRAAEAKTAAQDLLDAKYCAAMARLDADEDGDAPYLDPADIFGFNRRRPADAEVQMEFISVEDLTTGTTCDRSKTIKLEADHEYCIIYVLPEKDSVLDWKNAAFKSNLLYLDIAAGRGYLLSAAFSDERVALRDSVTFIAEDPLELLTYHDYYTMYGEPGVGEIGTLLSHHVAGSLYGLEDGALLWNSLEAVEKPYYITYTFKACLDASAAEAQKRDKDEVLSSQEPESSKYTPSPNPITPAAPTPTPHSYE